MTNLCNEAVTVAEVRARYGGSVDSLSDATIRRTLDNLIEEMEGTLGHGFGRAGWASASEAATLTITSLAATLGDDSYTFEDYPTLGELAAAVNGAGESYQIDLAPHVRPDTPCSLLRTRTATAIGPTYDLRQPLCLSALYYRATGGYTHLFLPLAVSSVVSVVESGTTLEDTDYWAQIGQPWLIRKACTCTGTTCGHVRGHWLATYPDNIALTYAPVGWGKTPGVVNGALVEAFGAGQGLGDLESEKFLGYEYRRKLPEGRRASDILSGATLRPYQVIVHL